MCPAQVKPLEEQVLGSWHLRGSAWALTGRLPELHICFEFFIWHLLMLLYGACAVTIFNMVLNNQQKHHHVLWQTEGAGGGYTEGGDRAWVEKEREVKFCT